MAGIFPRDLLSKSRQGRVISTHRCGVDKVFQSLSDGEKTLCQATFPSFASVPNDLHACFAELQKMPIFKVLYVWRQWSYCQVKFLSVHDGSHGGRYVEHMSE